VTTEGATSTLLDDEALGYLGRLGETIAYPSGATILRQGETGTAFWVILQGEVEVQLRSDEDDDQSLFRLGPRETFGELAILRSAPIGADVVAVTPVTVLRYPSELLPTALAECRSLRHSLLRRMAQNVHRRTDQAMNLYRQTRALADLYQRALPPDTMIGNSARMRAVAARIEEAAASRRPVLIAGESGTGKLLAARMIHAASRRSSSPLIAVDCRELSIRDANRLLFGTRRASDAELSAERFGALHLAHGGSLVLRGIEALNAETQRELARHFEAEREVETRPFPDVRIVATIDHDSRGADLGRLDDELRQQFGTIIEIPTLAERPRDIVPLATAFLREIDAGGRLRLTESAEQALVSLKYRHRNVAELHSVVELAARVADGDEIRAEHIFSGFDGERPIGFEISGFWLVRWLVGGGGLRVARIAVAAIFIGMAAICLTAGRTMAGESANAAVWMLWEPAVFGLVLPRSTAAGVDSARRKLALGRRVRAHPVVRGVLPHGREPFPDRSPPPRPHRLGGRVLRALATGGLVPPSLPPWPARGRPVSGGAADGGRPPVDLRVDLHDP
jgi:CRP-like cAMP-binding protein